LDVFLGLLSDSLLGPLAVLAILAALILLIVQLGSETRPFRWIAWFCLEASLVGIASSNFMVLASHMGYC
jgi:hypothetical protein